MEEFVNTGRFHGKSVCEEMTRVPLLIRVPGVSGRQECTHWADRPRADVVEFVRQRRVNTGLGSLCINMKISRLSDSRSCRSPAG